MTAPHAFPANHFDLAEGEHGMTLRDYFAAKALPSVIASYRADWVESRDWGQFTNTECEIIATNAYAVATAMLEARK